MRELLGVVVEEVPSMGVGMKVDDTPSMGKEKVIERNPSKERAIGINKVKVEYGDRACFHCHKRGYVQYTCNKL